MANESDKRDEALDPRVYFAAERTLLAWVRTGLAMMGFGFVVARFGLFLREIAAMRDLSSQRHSGTIALGRYDVGSPRSRCHPGGGGQAWLHH